MKAVRLGDLRHLDKHPELRGAFDTFVQRKFKELGDERGAEYLNKDPRFRGLLKTIRRGRAHVREALDEIDFLMSESAKRNALTHFLKSIQNAYARGTARAGSCSNLSGKIEQLREEGVYVDDIEAESLELTRKVYRLEVENLLRKAQERGGKINYQRLLRSIENAKQNDIDVSDLVTYEKMAELHEKALYAEVEKWAKMVKEDDPADREHFDSLVKAKDRAEKAGVDVSDLVTDEDIEAEEGRREKIDEYLWKIIDAFYECDEDLSNENFEELLRLVTEARGIGTAFPEEITHENMRKMKELLEKAEEGGETDLTASKEACDRIIFLIEENAWYASLIYLLHTIRQAPTPCLETFEEKIREAKEKGFNTEGIETKLPEVRGIEHECVLRNISRKIEEVEMSPSKTGYDSLVRAITKAKDADIDVSDLVTYEKMAELHEKALYAEVEKWAKMVKEDDPADREHFDSLVKAKDRAEKAGVDVSDLVTDEDIERKREELENRWQTYRKTLTAYRAMQQNPSSEKYALFASALSNLEEAGRDPSDDFSDRLIQRWQEKYGS